MNFFLFSKNFHEAQLDSYSQGRGLESILGDVIFFEHVSEKNIIDLFDLQVWPLVCVSLVSLMPIWGSWLSTWFPSLVFISLFLDLLHWLPEEANSTGKCSVKNYNLLFIHTVWTARMVISGSTFINDYVDTILPFLDHLTTSTWTFLTLNVDKIVWTFLDHLSTHLFLLT